MLSGPTFDIHCLNVGNKTQPQPLLMVYVYLVRVFLSLMGRKCTEWNPARIGVNHTTKLKHGLDRECQISCTVSQ